MIPKITFRDMTHDEVLGFCLETEKLLLLPEAHAYICESFSSALAAFVLELSRNREKFGEAIEEADAAVDRAWYNIRSQLRINIDHYDAAVRAAATEVLRVFERVENPTRLDFAKEYADLKILTGLLREIPSEKLERAQIDGWLSELERRIEVFRRLREEKTTAKGEIELGATKRARTELIENYQAMILGINALVHFNHSPELNSLVRTLSEHINAYRVRQKAKRAEKKERKGSY